jgi:chitinase
VYDKSKNVWVSYDNEKSLAAKGRFVRSNKLAGFAVWEAGGDYKNIVVNAIRAGVGLKA